MEVTKESEYERLSLQELQVIYVMKGAGASIRRMGESVGRAPSTVSKALNWYCHPSPKVWLNMTPLERAKHVFDEMRCNRHRSRFGGHIGDVVVREYVIRRLVDDHWSPEIIEAKIGEEFPGKSVCAKTIYTFIKKERRDLLQYLPERGKPRRQRVMHRRGRFKQGAPKKRSIHERTAENNDRQELGHWEGDTIITRRRGTKAILSLRERVTRQRIFRIVRDLKAETILAALRAILHELPPELRRSITLDNGSEFALSVLQCLETYYPGLKLYYCDAYHSWQKGAVENSNRDFRWYYPKGTDFGALSPSEVFALERKINARPMKCHGYKSAQEVFDRALAA